MSQWVFFDKFSMTSFPWQSPLSVWTQPANILLAGNFDKFSFLANSVHSTNVVYALQLQYSISFKPVTEEKQAIFDHTNVDLINFPGVSVGRA